MENEPLKYNPNLPKQNNNISHEKPFQEFFLFFLSVIVFLFIAYKCLDFLIDIGIDNLSPTLEKKLFSTIGDKLFEDYKADKNIQNLVNGLSKCADISYPLKARVKLSKQLNAFAFPGGQIVIFSSLINSSKSQNGLAFILAHEIGHFKNRDHLRMLGKSMLFSLLISSISNSSLDASLSPLTTVAQMKYSRLHETQADTIGLDILNCYYGHVGGAMEFFNSITKYGKNSIIAKYFASHPPTIDRIKNLNNLIKQKGYKVEKTIPMWH